MGNTQGDHATEIGNDKEIPGKFKFLSEENPRKFQSYFKLLPQSDLTNIYVYFFKVSNEKNYKHRLLELF